MQKSTWLFIVRATTRVVPMMFWATARVAPTMLFISMLAFGAFAQNQSGAYFSDHPSLSPDGSTLYFTYAGDIWKVPSAGGLATRLTAMEGDERFPRPSPDGKWLAFNAQQYGNTDVYLLPLDGGEIRQLTYHDANDVVNGWSWDSGFIYFTSSRYNRFSGYKVSVEGGTPMRLFPHYHHTVNDVAEHPRGGEIFFNESWESYSAVTRKGYKGDHNPDIQSYNPRSGEFKQYTNWTGKDFGVTFDRQGNFYFISDEANGEYNLYTFEKDKKLKLTDFSTSIWYPQVSANGEKVAFRRDYQIQVYDVKKKKAETVGIRIPQNVTLNKLQDFSIKGNISNFDVSDDGKKLAFISRGQVFVSDVKGKFIQQLATRSDGRALEIHWLKDNKTLLYNQTAGGYQNWFTQAADGSVPEKQLTQDVHNNRNLAFNSDKTKAVYLAGRHEMRLLDLTTMTSSSLLKDEFWDLGSDEPQFGPDDQHILYTGYRNFERDILVYNLNTKKIQNLTNTGVTEAAPRWAPDGKSIYFQANLTQASYPFGLQEPNLYSMALRAYDAPYRSDKVKELFKEEEKKTDKPAAKDSTAKKTPIQIDEAFLNERIEQIGPSFGSQGAPYVIQSGEKTIILFASNHDEGRGNLWKLVLEPFERPKTEMIQGATGFGFGISSAKNQHFVLTGGNIATLNIDANKVETINMEYTFRKKLSDEFAQMFYETWANLEQNFYDETFHGKNWKAIRDRYAAFLPQLNTRSDLRQLLNEMLGELNASHLAFTSNGTEEEIFYKGRSAGTGILFSNDDPYKVERVVARSPADRTDKDIRPGDRLIKVNGTAVVPRNNREQYLIQPSLDEEISLTFMRGQEERTVKIHPVSTFIINDLLYDEWEAGCQKRVDERSSKKIAYVHMKDMGGGALDHFLKQMVSEGWQRDALILDLRYNTGGNVHDKVLQFLSQKPYLQWKYREGQLSPQPNFTPGAKPIVLLVNEPSLSDAEMTTEGFKRLKLGTVVGTETYRWIIFTSGKGLVDGSFYRLPSWGCYSMDGKDLEITGVKPDVYVKNTFKDRLEGKDPQLDKAIDLILEKMK
ncbi:S41 family peptidase [Haliscomenobacter sp.]|uniref:S41 family peptidase n=1 Tax=Haliscomenobacter sp. TaxID=2717303 RepID=UPI003BA8FC34